MIIYSIGRFVVEHFRTDSLMLANFKMAQIFSIVLFIIGIILVIVSNKGSRFDNLYNEEKMPEIKTSL